VATYSYQVQRSTNGTTWSDIPGASGSFVDTPPFSHDVPYTIQSADADDYLRMKVVDAFGNISYGGLTGPVAISGGGGSVSGYQPYSASSAINIPIPSNPPIHPDTGLMISAANHWLLGGTAYDQYKEWLKPFSANNARAAYYRGDTSTLPSITTYANANGWVGAGPFTTPIPSWMASKLGPYSQTGDANMVIVDSITGDVWETWHTTPPGYTPRNSTDSSGNPVPNNRWNCSAWRHWPGGTNTKGYASSYSTSYHPSTSGSLIQLACGMLVPEDFADLSAGSVIPHALRIDTYCGANGSIATHPRFVFPAKSGDGRQNNGIPAGARIQLNPAINVDTWPSLNTKSEPFKSALKKICKTLQIYGGIQVDSYGGPGNGSIDCVSDGTVAMGGDTYSVGYEFPWVVAGYTGSFQHSVPYDLMSEFRIIDYRQWTGA
jgi:hypothetical protein